jgi:RimJ/RimL family protein N-acetyltransferase
MALVNEGRLVRIRPVREDDLPDLTAWKLDSDALSGFDAPSIRSLDKARRQHAEDGFLSPECSIYAVEAIADERLVGRVGFFRDSPVYDTMLRTMSLIGSPEDRGRGYATEARILLVNYLYLSTSVERVYSETEERNAPARRSLEKTGMTFEGILRHLFFDQGRWADIAVYSIIRPEWAESETYRPYREPFVRPWFDE